MVIAQIDSWKHATKTEAPKYTQKCTAESTRNLPFPECAMSGVLRFRVYSHGALLEENKEHAKRNIPGKAEWSITTEILIIQIKFLRIL